jgi:hypothetical protein
MAIQGTDDKAVDKFYELREEFLTNKFTAEDYAFTSLILAFLCALLSASGNINLSTPQTKKKTRQLGLLCALLVPITIYLTYMLDKYRGGYPHWEKAEHSTSIIYASFGSLVIATIWIIFHFYFLKEPFLLNEKIFRIPKFNKKTAWLIIITGISASLFIKTIFYGRFLSIIPASLWLYFYASLLTGKSKGIDEKF